MKMFLEEISSCLKLPFSGENRLISSVALDSRKVKEGALFVCIKGENADGHDYMAKALENGAQAILASRNCEYPVPAFVTDNVILALGKIAEKWRKKTRSKVICLTGTAGKTTLKEILKSIFSRRHRVIATEKNYNNQIGLPCTMLDADGNEDFWILEAGISHAGDMEELGEIAKPDMGIILNIGPGHTEGLGKKGVAWHKSRLLNYISPGGKALVSADYPQLRDLCDNLQIRPCYFSAQKNENVPFYIEDADVMKGRYYLSLEGDRYEVNTPIKGAYAAELIIAAAAAACLNGIEREDIKSALECAQMPPQRFNHFNYGKYQIFDDCYNANPLSMFRMIDAVSQFSKMEKMPFILILGEMGELGDEAEKWHRELGRKLASLNPYHVFWKGNYSDNVMEGIRETRNSLLFSKVGSPEEFIAKCKLNNEEKFAVLFKGSRLNKLENFLEAFKKDILGGKENVL